MKIDRKQLQEQTEVVVLVDKLRSEANIVFRGVEYIPQEFGPNRVAGSLANARAERITFGAWEGTIEEFRQFVALLTKGVTT